MSSKDSRPGWYPNPHGPGQRWWNGLSWSDAYLSDAGHPMDPVSAGVKGAVVHRGHAPARQRSSAVGSFILLAIIAACMVLAMIFWGLRDGVAIPGDYVTTTGTIAGVEVSGDTCYDVISYTVSGVDYEVRDTVGEPDCTPLGLAADVAYDPADPAQALVPHPLGVTILTVAAVVPLVIAVLLGLVLARRFRL